jgi:diguanylate cyclase (GGDEF)-like protein
VSPLVDIETIIATTVSECVDAFPELAVTVYVQLGAHRWFRSALRSVTSLRSVPPLGSLVRRVFETGETLIVPDIAAMPAWQDWAGESDQRIRGLIAVPVGPSRDRTVGVLYLSGPNRVQLPSFELDLLHGIARRAGQALRPHVAALVRAPESVRLTPEQFERLSREAMEDPLTGLTNRHGGELALQRELARAKREKRSVSVVLFDVDHFKQVNDTRGHAVGDRILRSIARIATDCVRASDLVVRWGGEEFLVVLPSVAVDGARDVGERIRSRIESADHEPLGVTISGGASEVESAEHLPIALERADAQLHRAKAEGRNRVR